MPILIHYLSAKQKTSYGFTQACHLNCRCVKQTKRCTATRLNKISYSSCVSHWTDFKAQGALVEEGMDIPTARTTEYMLLLAFLSGQNIMAFSGFVRYIRALSK